MRGWVNQHDISPTTHTYFRNTLHAALNNLIWFLEFVGAPRSARLLCHPPTFRVDRLGREQAAATGRGHYVVQSSDTVVVCNVVEPHVIRNDGLGHRPDGVATR